MPPPTIGLDAALRVRFKEFEPLDVAVEDHFEAPPGTVLCPDDGVPGSGCDFFDYGELSAAGSAILARSDRVALLPYTGAGHFTAVARGEGQVAVTGGVLDVEIASFIADGIVVLVYEYRERCPDDLDGDGVVGFSDLQSLLLGLPDGAGGDEVARLLAAWGPCPGSR